MNLAKGRNGKIGRQVPGQGLQAKVVQPSGGGYSRNLFLTEGQIAEDQHYFKVKDQRARAMGMARQAQMRQRQVMKAKRQMMQGMGVESYQRLSRVNPLNDKLKLHFARQLTMGQSQKVAGQLYHSPNGATSGYTAKPRPPADFSNSGANMHLVPGVESRGTVVWSADHRIHMIKGNPLTRDGVYGPRVTDYDRFVNGVDVNQSVVQGADMPIAGNTMLGYYEGSGKRKSLGLKGFGDDSDMDFSDFEDPDPSAVDFSYFDEPDTSTYSSFDSSMPVTDNTVPTEAELQAATPDQPGFLSKVWTSAEVAADKSLPTLLQQQMASTIAAGGKVGTTKGGTIVISQPGKPISAIATSSTSLIPPVVIYASVGLIAVGLILFLTRGRSRAAVPAIA